MFWLLHNHETFQFQECSKVWSSSESRREDSLWISSSKRRHHDLLTGDLAPIPYDSNVNEIQILTLLHSENESGKPFHCSLNQGFKLFSPIHFLNGTDRHKTVLSETNWRSSNILSWSFFWITLPDSLVDIERYMFLKLVCCKISNRTKQSTSIQIKHINKTLRRNKTFFLPRKKLLLIGF